MFTLVVSIPHMYTTCEASTPFSSSRRITRCALLLIRARQKISLFNTECREETLGPSLVFEFHCNLQLIFFKHLLDFCLSSIKNVLAEFECMLDESALLVHPYLLSFGIELSWTEDKSSERRCL